MKNKEIEELLNTMKDKECYYVGTNGCLYQDLTKEEIGLLLSYIEQLENLCNKYEQEHKTTFEIWKKDIKKLEQLQNNRDKAIDKLYCWGEVLQPDFQKEMLNILKGGSDE